MPSVATSTPAAGRHAVRLGATIPFDVLDTPGAYVCNWSGHLLRVPRGAVTLGCSPAVNLVGNTPLTVTRISDDPEVTISDAKRLAAAYHLDVNF